MNCRRPRTHRDLRTRPAAGAGEHLGSEHRFICAGWLLFAFAHNAWQVDQPWVRLGHPRLDADGRDCVPLEPHSPPHAPPCIERILRGFSSPLARNEAGRIPGLSPHRPAIHPGNRGELVGRWTCPESPCHGPGSVFALLSVFDEHLADDRHVLSAAARLVRVQWLGEEGLR